MTAAPVLTTTAQIRALDVFSADSHFPLRVQGVVTFYDPVNHLLFIQDETGGAFINFTRPFPIVKGSRVLVTGFTEADFTNTINKPTIRELGRGPLPNPRPVPFRDITGGREDCNLVSLTGIVRRASFETNHIDAKHNQRVLVIRLATLDGEIEAHLIDFGKLTPASLIDSTIRIAAVVGADYNDQSQFVQAIVMIPDWHEVEVLRWGENNFSAVHLLPIQYILRYQTVAGVDARVRSEGTVTYYDRGRTLTIQNGKYALQTRLVQDDSVRLGDRVEVTGFASLGWNRPVLEGGRFRILHSRQSGEEVKPQQINARTALTGEYSYSLVSIKARLLGIVQANNQQTLNLEDDKSLFPAVYDSSGGDRSLSRFQPGSLVNVTGICLVQQGGLWDYPQSFRLVLRTPQDIELISAPTWWTSSHFRVVLGIAATLVLGSFGSLYLLRRRLAAQQIQLQRAAALQRDRNELLKLVGEFAPSDEIVKGIKGLIEHQWPGSRIDIDFAVDGSCEPLVHNDPRAWVRVVRSSREQDLAVLSVLPRPQYRAENPDNILDVARGIVALALEHRELYEQLVSSSRYDALTGLPNRETWKARMRVAMETALQEDNWIGVAFIDMDGFKGVNDELGHKAGDFYLQHVARSIQSCLRRTDLVARWGGDEFLVLSPGVRSQEEARELGERLLRAIRTCCIFDGQSIRPSASIGIALFPLHDGCSDGIVQKADQAMYAAKSDKSDRVRVYEPCFEREMVYTGTLSRKSLSGGTT